MRITIKKEAVGERLDKFLTEKLIGISRSEIQKKIKIGEIVINGVPATPHYFVKAGDLVEEKKIKKAIKENIEKITSAKDQPKQPVLKIIHETEDYLVINKPAGIMVHPSETSTERTLVDYILKKYPGIAKIGEDPIRPGIAHRLDKEVSGLMVIAKTQNFFDHIKNQFQTRKTKKIYTALIYGKIEKDMDMINFPIKRSVEGYKMSALPYLVKGEKNIEGKTAITEFEVEKRYVNYTLLKVNIKTGRTHQIRAHLSAYGHPLVGDDLYGTRKTREKNQKLYLGRIFLIANELSFTDLSGHKQEFSIKLPKELMDILEKIK